MLNTVNNKNAVAALKSIWTRLYYDRYLYLLLIPGLLVIILFKYAPMGGLVVAFKNYNAFVGMMGSPWVGFKNFVDIFTAHDFWSVLRNTLLISIYKLSFGFPVAIILSLLLNEMRNKHFKKTVQTVIYLPHFISWVVISGIMFALLSPNTGVISDVFDLLKIKHVNILAQPSSFRAVLVISEIWKEAGWSTIIYLASFSIINEELYEAATIDGAGRWQKAWHITLPAISGVIVLLLILQVGFLMDAGFDQIQVLQTPIVRDVSDIFDTYSYRRGIMGGAYSFTAAMGLFKSVVAVFLILVADRTAKSIGEEGLL